MTYLPVTVFNVEQAKTAFNHIPVNTIVYCLNAYSNTFRPCFSLMESFEFYRDDSYSDLVKKYTSLIKDKRLGTVSQIEEKIQDVGEYELILTLKLKK